MHSSFDIPSDQLCILRVLLCTERLQIRRRLVRSNGSVCLAASRRTPCLGTVQKYCLLITYLRSCWAGELKVIECNPYPNPHLNPHSLTTFWDAFDGMLDPHAWREDSWGVCNCSRKVQGLPRWFTLNSALYSEVSLVYLLSHTITSLSPHA